MKYFKLFLETLAEKVFFFRFGHKYVVLKSWLKSFSVKISTIRAAVVCAVELLWPLCRQLSAILPEISATTVAISNTTTATV